MKLYHVTRESECEYDEYDEFVIRAETKEDAIEVAMQREFPGYTKADITKFRCPHDDWKAEELNHSGEQEIIVFSFHAG